MESVFITGGAGFIGSFLCRKLIASGSRIVIFDNFSSSSHKNFLEEFSGSVEVLEGDITDKETILAAMNSVKPEVVVHLAACVSVQKSLENPQKTFHVNVTGTRNVLDASLLAGVKKFIFASSAAVYGNLEPPLSENKVLLEDKDYEESLLSPYAVSKFRGEELVAKSELNTTIFRIFNVYGPGQKKSGGYAAVIPEFISRLKKGEILEVYGDGKQTRDFIFIKDIVRAIDTAIQNISFQGIFNLASGISTSLKSLISIMEDVFSSKALVNYNPSREGDIFHSYADISRIQKKISFKPEISLEEGIRQMI